MIDRLSAHLVQQALAEHQAAEPPGFRTDRAGDVRGARLEPVRRLGEGGPLAMLFAATYPERTTALCTFGSMAKAFSK